MAIWYETLDLATIKVRSEQTMVTHLGIEFIEVGDDYLTASMPVDHRTHQPIGIMHGGASCVLAETVASTAGNFCVDMAHYYCVGLEINTNHIRSIKTGHVFALARPFHLGKTTQVWHIEIKNSEEKIISINRLTLAVLKRSGSR